MLQFLAAIPKIAAAANVVGNVGAAISKGGQKSSFQKLAGVGSALSGQSVAPQGRSETGQNVAIDIATAGPSETATSGEIAPMMQPSTSMQGIVPASYRGIHPTSMRGGFQQANLPAIVGGAVGATRSIGGMLGLAGGAIMVAPTIIDMVTGEEKKLRVTRRLRSQVKQAVQMFGAEVVADNMGTSVEVIFYILTKKMRNDGAYVTKAAVRKTRQTVRKMKHLCDMYDDLRPPARRAPARRTASKTTLIKN